MRQQENKRITITTELQFFFAKCLNENKDKCANLDGGVPLPKLIIPTVRASTIFSPRERVTNCIQSGYTNYNRPGPVLVRHKGIQSMDWMNNTVL